MWANPRDWRIASLEAVAAGAGVNVGNSGGSYMVFEHPDIAEALSGAGPMPNRADLCPAVRPVH